MKRDFIQFNSEAHVYSYQGKVLSGITGFVGKQVSKDYSKAGSFVEPYTEFGRMVHDEVEEYIKRGTKPTHQKSKWIVKYLERFPRSEWVIYSEFLVSDFENSASAIDIIAINPRMEAYLFDIKAGVFNRDYCSWQLGTYKYFAELEGDIKVIDTYVLSTKDEMAYRIIPKSAERCAAMIKNNLGVVI